MALDSGNMPVFLASNEGDFDFIDSSGISINIYSSSTILTSGEMNIYLSNTEGEFDFINSSGDSLDIFTHGIDSSSGNMPISVFGSVDGSFLIYDSLFNDMNVYSSGAFGGEGRLNLYTVAKDSASGDMPIYTSGVFLSDGNMDIYTAGHIVSTGDMDIYSKGLDSSSGDMPIFIPSHEFELTLSEFTSSSMSIYTLNTIISSGDMDIFTSGVIGVETGDLNIYTDGNQLGTDTLDIFTKGIDSGNFDINIYSFGVFIAEDSGVSIYNKGYEVIPLYNKGYESIDIYTKGYESIPLNVTGSITEGVYGTPSGEMGLYTIAPTGIGISIFDDGDFSLYSSGEVITADGSLPLFVGFTRPVIAESIPLVLNSVPPISLADSMDIYSFGTNSTGVMGGVFQSVNLFGIGFYNNSTPPPPATYIVESSGEIFISMSGS